MIQTKATNRIRIEHRDRVKGSERHVLRQATPLARNVGACNASECTKILRVINLCSFIQGVFRGKCIGFFESSMCDSPQTLRQSKT
jgi:hypothetical protein